MVTRAGYEFHGCLVVNPKKELEFKMSVTAVLQDMNSMYLYITYRKTHYVYLHFKLLLKNNAASILLASALEIGMTE